MGFRNSSFARVWQTESKSDTCTNVRISISRKNKQTNEYEQDFSGFVSFVGTANAAKALKLKEGDRIKLGDVDVTTRYDKDKKVTYTNYKAFSFELDDDTRKDDPQPDVDDGDYAEKKPRGKQLPF